MRYPARRFLLVLLLIALATGFSACATHHYVKQQVASIEPQIAEVRNAQTEQVERIDSTSRLARTAMDVADQAAMTAVIANDAAVAAGRKAADAERKADAAQVNSLRAMNEIDGVANQFEHRIASLDKYSVTEQKAVTFKFDSDVLSKEAISRLDDIAGAISGTPKGYLVELQGFTDAVGTEKYNFSLSERRAESVLRYLVSKGVPLHRISIVGLGNISPVADNKTPGGREQNRRVEIRVLRSGTVNTANR